MFDLMPFRKRNEDALERMFKSFNEVFEQNGLSPLNGKVNSFKTDITEKEDAYYVEAELPGFSKEDIDIEVNNNYLTIRAERNQVEEEKDKNDIVVRRERHYGKFFRQFYIDDIKEQEIEAKLEEGILKIKLPKLNTEKPNRQRIEIH